MNPDAPHQLLNLLKQQGGSTAPLSSTEKVLYKSMMRSLLAAGDDKSIKIHSALLNWSQTGSPEDIKKIRDVLHHYKASRVNQTLGLGDNARQVIDWVTTLGKKQMDNIIATARSLAFDTPVIGKAIPEGVLGVTPEEKLAMKATKQPGNIKALGRLLRGWMPVIGGFMGYYYSKYMPNEGNLETWDELSPEDQQLLKTLQDVSRNAGTILGTGGLLTSIGGDIMQQGLQVQGNAIAGLP